MKNEKRLEARRLRTENQLSLKAISEKLGVSKSSVSLWVRDLPLTPERLQELGLVGRTTGGDVRSTKARGIRRKYQQEGFDLAERLKQDTLFVSGCVMHWAGGR